MSGKICCFTGHRHIEDKYVFALNGALKQRLEALVEEGYTVFKAGGAIGFDTMAALNVLLLKKKYGFIRLELYLPCRDQTKKWGGSDKKIYDFILKNADSITYVSEDYTRDCMFKRNRALVDQSDLCIAFCNTSAFSGGSVYTVKYAKEKGVACENLFTVINK